MASEIPRNQELIRPAGRHQCAWSGGGLSCEGLVHCCEQGQAEGDRETIVALLYGMHRLHERILQLQDHG